jgi:hypothetical protein
MRIQAEATIERHVDATIEAVEAGVPPLVLDLSPLEAFRDAPDDALIPMSDAPPHDGVVRVQTARELAHAMNYAGVRLGYRVVPNHFATALTVTHEKHHAKAAETAGFPDGDFWLYLGCDKTDQRAYIAAAMFALAACEIPKIAAASIAIHPWQYSGNDRDIIDKLNYKSVAELDERIVSYNALRGAHLLRPKQRAIWRDQRVKPARLRRLPTA